LVTDLPADFDVALQGVDTQMLTNANAAIAKTIVDAKGDIIAATGADAVSRLVVGANDTVLTADSTTATGLKWAAAASGMKLVVRTAFSAVANTGTTFDNVFTSTYKRYLLLVELDASANDNVHFQGRYAGPTTQATDYYGCMTSVSSSGVQTFTGDAGNTRMTAFVRPYSSKRSHWSYWVGNAGTDSQQITLHGTGFGHGNNAPNFYGGKCEQARTYTGFILTPVSGTITGNVAIYGLVGS